MIKLCLKIQICLLLVLTTIALHAQPITGVKTIGGANPDYATIQAAITDLNTNGTALGGVEFNVAAGHTETAVNLILNTTTGSENSTIVFRKFGSGNNPLITAGTGTSTTVDAVIKIAGTDYVTFDGIDIYDNPATNTTNTTRMEWGYAVVKGSATNGSQYVTIKNCNVTLQKANTASRGIYSGNHIATSTTALTVNVNTGTNTGLSLQGNLITNAFNGIFITGATNAQYFDDSINIGGTTRNTITNFGGSGTAYGIYLLNFANAIIKNDSIYQDINVGSTSSTHYGIYTGSSLNSNANIEDNYIRLTIAGTSSTRTVYGIYCLNGNTSNLIKISGNTIKNISCAASSSILSAIYTSSTANIEITNNVIDSFTRVGTSGNTQVIYSALAATSRIVSGNTISNINASGTSAQIRAIGIPAGGGVVSNNTISNIQSAGTSADTKTIDVIGTADIFNNTINTVNHASSTTGECYIIFSQGGNATIYNNTISNIATGGSFLVTIELAGTANEIYNVYRNKISITSSTNNSCVVSGIRQSGGSTATIHSNLIGPLSGGPSTTVGNGVNGINVTSTAATVSNIYHNNVFLNTTTSGGTNCLLLSTATDATVINNIFINLSANSSTTTRSACAIRRIGNSILSYNIASDNNLFYVGITPTANRFIFTDGTNNFIDLNTYKTFVVNRDQSSISNNVIFNSTNINNQGYLEPMDTSYIESMGKTIDQFTADFIADQSRLQYPQQGQLGGGGIAPDIGAFELDMAFIDLVPPSIIAPVITKTLLSTYKLLEPVYITDNSGINTTNTPLLYFRKTSNTNVLATSNNFSVDGWKSVVATQNGSHYSFFIDYSLLHPTGQVTAADTIEYFIVAQDNSNMQNVRVSGAVLSQPPTSTILSSVNFPALNVNSYRILANAIPSYVTVGGIGADYASLTQPGGFFEAVNNGIIDNNVTVVINGDLTNENGTIALQRYAEEGFSIGNSTITIQPMLPSLYQITGTNTLGGIIRVQDAERLIIDGSYFNNGKFFQLTNLANTGNRSTVQIIGTVSGGGSRNIQLKNCIVNGNDNTNTGNFAIAIGGTTVGVGTGAAQGISNKNITIENNFIHSANVGILVNGNVAQPADSLLIHKNTIGNDSLTNSIYNAGIFVRGMVNSNIEFNNISNVLSDGTTGVYGITVSAECNKLKINGNRIDNIKHLTAVSVPAYGIYSNATTVLNLTISNNIITRVLAQGGSADFSTAPVGIFLNNGNNSFIINNTISLSGNRLNHVTGGAYSACLYVRSPITNLVVANNIFRNVMGSENLINAGSNFALATSAASIAAFSYLNHNIYEVSSPTNGVSNNLAINGSNLRADLQAWRTFSNQDRQSFWGNPGLINDSIALPDTTNANSWMANGRGLPWENIESDFYNSQRSTSIQNGAVDIGAVDYTPNVLPPAAVASASPLANTTTYYTLWNDTIGSIAWSTGFSVPSTFEMRYFSGTNPPNTTSNNHFNAYWDFVVTPATAFDYQLTLYYKPEAMYTINNGLNVTAAFLDNTMMWQPAPTNNVVVNPTNRQLTVSSLSYFTIFTGTDNTNPLPIKLVSFTGKKLNNQVLLNWVTTQANNFSHVEIEYSTNNQKWVGLHKVDGKNIDDKANFSWIHSQPSTQNYYRLKLVDLNGTYAYSRIVYVNFDETKTAITPINVMPNPAVNQVTVSSYNNTAINLKGIFDITGKEVTNLCEFNGELININNLNNGIYFILIDLENGTTQHLKFIKQ